MLLRTLNRCGAKRCLSEYFLQDVHVRPCVQIRTPLRNSVSTQLASQVSAFETKGDKCQLHWKTPSYWRPCATEDWTWNLQLPLQGIVASADYLTMGYRPQIAILTTNEKDDDSPLDFVSVPLKCSNKAANCDQLLPLARNTHLGSGWTAKCLGTWLSRWVSPRIWCCRERKCWSCRFAAWKAGLQPEGRSNCP